MFSRNLLVLSTGLLACGPATSGGMNDRDRTTGCRVSIVAELAAGPKRWYGACTAKGPYGSEVLSAADGAFYGTMSNGNPVRGAIEDSSGVRFGSFIADKFVQSDRAQDNLNSYRAAAAGARTGAARLARANNRTSARYYGAKAKIFEGYED